MRWLNRKGRKLSSSSLPRPSSEPGFERRARWWQQGGTWVVRRKADRARETNEIDWREMHVKCTYNGVQLSETEFPKNWLTDGIQIKIQPVEHLARLVYLLHKEEGPNKKNEPPNCRDNNQYQYNGDKASAKETDFGNYDTMIFDLPSCSVNKCDDDNHQHERIVGLKWCHGLILHWHESQEYSYCKGQASMPIVVGCRTIATLEEKNTYVIRAQQSFLKKD
ncbi:hypothetical protein GOBAR_AA01960 [Gossypium barbadense]|uniref:Uncharacterized protein n=1 Tax=Gossypium barbadense TaxID=3634 RepID=A0A2P5YST8_GOSBA|nr:hypothetical protein GOBAR_AA01960 [Gossypium barbadense]